MAGIAAIVGSVAPKRAGGDPLRDPRKRAALWVLGVGTSQPNRRDLGDSARLREPDHPDAVEHFAGGDCACDAEVMVYASRCGLGHVAAVRATDLVDADLENAQRLRFVPAPDDRPGGRVLGR